MKKFNDTYAGLFGKRRYITSDTKIMFEDETAADQIRETAEDAKNENVISEVSVCAINNGILKRIRKQNMQDLPKPAADSYAIEIADGKIRIYTNSKSGVKYAACAIRSHYDNGIRDGYIYNVPLAPFRGVKVYVPAYDNIPFFKEFVDMCMNYGYNTLIMEVGGAMEYKKHPEINEGWVEYCNIFRGHNGKANKAQACMPWNKNSIHWENGGGKYLSQKQISELIEYCNAHGLRVIPEVPSLSHCDYLLTRHPELAENRDDPIPDAYCPSNPATYELLFDVLDEVIEVFKPDMVHIAHDELYSVGVCEKCAGKDAGVLYAKDINKIYSYLKQKDIDSMIWGDKLFTCVCDDGNTHGAKMITRKIPSDETVTIRGKEYTVNKELWGVEAHSTDKGFVFMPPSTESSMDLVPRDIKIMNWYHDIQPKTDDIYHENGFWSVFGNMNPRACVNWHARIAKGVNGLSISNWSMLDYRHMQRNDILFSVAYGSMMLWNRDFDEDKREENTLAAAHDLFEYRWRNIKNQPYAEVVHGTDVTIPHPLFVDGCYMDEDADRMGYYRIEYEDGSSELYDIYWGLNIGVVIPDWWNQKDDKSGKKSGVLEPTYTCDYVMIENKAYYKLRIPLKKRAVKITPEIFDKYQNSVEVKSITINNE